VGKNRGKQKRTNTSCDKEQKRSQQQNTPPYAKEHQHMVFFSKHHWVFLKKLSFKIKKTSVQGLIDLAANHRVHAS